MSSDLSIVGVHGVGHHAPGHDAAAVAAHRSAEWTAALASGLGIDPSNVSVAYTYWAPLLHADQPIAQGTDPDQSLDLLELHDPDSLAMATEWLDALDLPDVVVQGRLTAPLRHAAALVADRFSLDGRLTKLFVASLFREVATYLTDTPRRDAVREHVASAIATHQPRIVIAHSLGSVITHEALHAHPDLQVDLLLTIGSPLALPHGVFERLNPAPTNGFGARPPGVHRWVNVSDTGDIVAIVPPFAKRFPDVDLDVRDRIHAFDFHTAHNYLRSRAVADAVRPYLTDSGTPDR